MDSLVMSVSIMSLTILLFIAVLKKWNQPSALAYLLAGVILGPNVLKVFKDAAQIKDQGEIGLLFLLFFLGLEIEVPDQKNALLRPLLAQISKMIVIGLVLFAIGKMFHWSGGQILLLSALMIFNSTAIVSEYLTTTGELTSTIGQVAIYMLLLQDIMVAPVLTIVQASSVSDIHWSRLLASAIGSVLICLLIKAVKNRQLYQLPLWKNLQEDHDFQVFAGTVVCFGFAGLASIAGLSAPIGSFVAGIYLGRTKVFHWLGTVLLPFKIFFVGLFFVSIGLSIDISYLIQHIGTILLLSLTLLFVNCFITALVFRMLHYDWKESFVGGALLSQTGELGFLICTVAYNLGLINQQFSKMALAVTGITLMLSTIWIALLRTFILSPPLKQA